MAGLSRGARNGRETGKASNIARAAVRVNGRRPADEIECGLEPAAPAGAGGCLHQWRRERRASAEELPFVGRRRRRKARRAERDLGDSARDRSIENRGNWAHDLDPRERSARSSTFMGRTETGNGSIADKKSDTDGFGGKQVRLNIRILGRIPRGARHGLAGKSRLFGNRSRRAACGRTVEPAARKRRDSPQIQNS